VKNLIRQVGVKNCDDCPVSYRFINHEDKIYQTSIIGYSHSVYENNIKRAEIFEDGKLIVYDGAGSDGCTPVWLFANRWYGGIPNGRKIMTSSGLLEPITARAFYGHDWLLKMSDAAGIPKEDIHKFFCKEIKKTNFWLKGLYCRLVLRFGPRD